MSNRKIIKADIYNECEAFELEASLRAYIKRAFCEAQKAYTPDYAVQCSVTFVEADEIRRCNLENRSIDSVTDVLSFPLLEGKDGVLDEDSITDGEFDDEGFLMLGDVVLCYDVAKQQAEEYGHSEEREIVYLFVHSIMHLLGFDHMEDGDKQAMRIAEEKIMNRIGLSRDE